MDEPTPEQIAQHYNAMGDSVWLINAVITGEQLAGATQEAKDDCVDRNVRHLEIMLARDFWTSEDMTEVESAIAAGRAYLG